MPQHLWHRLWEPRLSNELHSKGHLPAMLILGLNMFHADASAAIVHDGEVIFAVAEERLNRKKHFGGFPALAVMACLNAAGAKITDIDHVAVGQDSDAN